MDCQECADGLQAAFSKPISPVLADLTRSAVNDALVNVRNRVQQEMRGVAGDMDLSGIQKMMGMPS